MLIRRTKPLAMLAALLSTSTLPAQAETLQEALAAAYRDNPTLTAARAGQRATDENFNIQKANGLPDVGVSSTYNEFAHERPLNPLAPSRSLTTLLSVSVPVYSGGRVRNALAGARERIEAGQYDLRATELSIFSQVVAAYMDVIRAESVVGLSRNNVQVLEVNLRATNNRFQVGDLTRTDVAQSESRLSLARADMQTAEASLIEARERYIQLVGHEPVDLQTPPQLPGLPATPDEAVDVAMAQNPDLLAARNIREAAAYDVRVAKGQRLPTVSAFASGQHYTDLASRGGANEAQDSGQVIVGARLSMPLYQGGRPGAQVRQSQAYQQQAMETETAVERSVIAQTRSLYSSWQASNEVIASNRVAVDASGLSLRGVRAENSVGTRTILDILNAEQESFIASVQLVTAERNAYVAAFSLLAAMGRINPTDFGIAPEQVINPADNFQRVKGKWFDWDDDAKPAPISSRTVDSAAQNATVNASDTN
ncbi:MULTISPECIES: TolC family outer membrane protein [unclassified Sphingobium]|uniref:TolC family outer membrane protein n=2 Tax=Sphingobium TaxID=165695 RepID=UPI002224CB0C|nr:MULTISPECIES: TolC family outer membrane protein [unclassified Sphingobium]MCW2370376.1 outer membrane protein [Sphingobium sp. B11D3D]MCW2381039.1 outer membrane protein [Sphingobium sp. B2D3B]MCW2398854.1 outer membrane protein [Sphingobium sp. B2D3C]